MCDVRSTAPSQLAVTDEVSKSGRLRALRLQGGLLFTVVAKVDALSLQLHFASLQLRSYRIVPLY